MARTTSREQDREHVISNARSGRGTAARRDRRRVARPPGSGRRVGSGKLGRRRWAAPSRAAASGPPAMSVGWPTPPVGSNGIQP